MAATLVHDDLTAWQGVLVEAWLTFILVQTIWGATNSARKKLFMPSIPIGLAVAMDIMAGVRLM